MSHNLFASVIEKMQTSSLSTLIIFSFVRRSIPPERRNKNAYFLVSFALLLAAAGE